MTRLDRRFFIAVTACLLFSFVLQFLYSKLSSSPPEQTQIKHHSIDDKTTPSSSISSVASVETNASKVASVNRANTSTGNWLAATGDSIAMLGHDKLRIAVSSHGGELISATLPWFHLPNGSPVDLIEHGRRGALALTLVLNDSTIDMVNVPFTLSVERTSSGKPIRVTCVAVHSSGLQVERKYEMSGEYTLTTSVVIAGISDRIRSAHYWIRWEPGMPVTERNIRQDEGHFAAIAQVGSEFYEDKPSDFGKISSKSRSGNIQWVGVRNKYFIVALIPPTGVADSIQTSGDKTARISRFVLSFPSLSSSKTRHVFRLYLGPIDYKHLAAFRVGLERVANMGWSWTQPLSRLLLWGLIQLYSIIPNYGIAIILISVLTKLVFYPLSRSSLRNMREMQRLQPALKELQTKYKNVPEKLNKETMALFREHRVNPLGGCLPMLVQMPVFVALYGVLSSAVQLRNASFILWITDLSSPDTIGNIGGVAIHLLPLVMTATSLVQAKMTPTDPRQAMTTYMMPVMMLFLFYSLPSGLVLYWTVNNVMTIIQQHAMKLNLVSGTTIQHCAMLPFARL
jgi:YidC/Oxa1 family membrane protein insertase